MSPSAVDAPLKYAAMAGGSQCPRDVVRSDPIPSDVSASAALQHITFGADYPIAITLIPLMNAVLFQRQGIG